MDSKFKPLLMCLSRQKIEDTLENIKNTDKLLFARLCVILYCSSNGLDITKVIKKIKKMSETKLIAFISPDFRDVELKNIDDVINFFESDMSVDNFLWVYGMYNEYCVDNIYAENIKNGNIDGTFEVMSKEEKVEVLLSISEKVRKELTSVYTDAHLTTIWNEFDEDDKLEALVRL